MLAAVTLAALVATPTPHHYICARDTFGWIGCNPLPTPEPRRADDTFCAQHHAGRFEAIIRASATTYYVACSGADYRWNGHWSRIERWDH